MPKCTGGEYSRLLQIRDFFRRESFVRRDSTFEPFDLHKLLESAQLLRKEEESQGIWRSNSLRQNSRTELKPTIGLQHFAHAHAMAT